MHIIGTEGIPMDKVITEAEKTAPCPRSSRKLPHPQHDWPAPVDGLSHCPGWPPVTEVKGL